MVIYDKASWQIENGIDAKKVVDHFTIVFKWLKSKNMLSDDGMELLDIGIDRSVVLSENMVNEKGNTFLKQNYDKFIETTEYNTDIEEKILEMLLK